MAPTWATDLSLPGSKSSVPLTRGALPPNYLAVCGGKNPCAAIQQQQQQQRAALRGDRT